MPVCAHAQKKKEREREGPNLSPLDDLETLNKQKVKAKAELQTARTLKAHPQRVLWPMAEGLLFQGI